MQSDENLLNSNSSVFLELCLEYHTWNCKVVPKPEQAQRNRSVHPFPARMAPEIALEALSVLEPGSTVVDPMCGSGLVLREAVQQGHKAIGFDVDPLAVLMSKVWTQSLDASELLERSEAIIKEAAWGRMAIVDTKPFKLRVILHRIFVERPQVTGIPAWPGGAACYRGSRYIL